MSPRESRKYYKAALLFTFLFSVNLIFAETDSTGASSSVTKSKIKYGVNASIYSDINFSSFKDGSFHSSSQLMASKGKISILAGPIWWVNRNKEINTFRGVNISCRYLPNNNNGKLNFYFLYDLTYSSQTSQWNKPMFYSAATQYDVDFKSTIHSLNSLLGYGVMLKVYKGLFIAQNFGIGVECYNYKSVTNVPDQPALSDNYSTGNIFSNIRSTSIFKAGLEYHFE